MNCNQNGTGPEQMTMGRIEFSPQVAAPAADMIGAFSEQQRFRKESEVLRALLSEWYSMFAPARRDGTEWATLIDNTAKALAAELHYKTPNAELRPLDAALCGKSRLE